MIRIMRFGQFVRRGHLPQKHVRNWKTFCGSPPSLGLFSLGTLVIVVRLSLSEGL